MKGIELQECNIAGKEGWCVFDTHHGLPVGLYDIRQKAEKHLKFLVDANIFQIESARLWVRSAIILRSLYEEVKCWSNSVGLKEVTGLEPIHTLARYPEMFCRFGGVVEMQIKALLRLKKYHRKKAKKVKHRLDCLLTTAEQEGCNIDREFARWKTAYNSECDKDISLDLVSRNAPEVVQCLSIYRFAWYWGDSIKDQNFPGEGDITEIILLAHVLDHLLRKHHVLMVHNPFTYWDFEMFSICDLTGDKFDEAVLGMIRPWFDHAKVWDPMWYEYSTIHDWWLPCKPQPCDVG